MLHKDKAKPSPQSNPNSKERKSKAWKLRRNYSFIHKKKMKRNCNETRPKICKSKVWCKKQGKSCSENFFQMSKCNPSRKHWRKQKNNTLFFLCFSIYHSLIHINKESTNGKKKRKKWQRKRERECSLSRLVSCFNTPLTPLDSSFIASAFLHSFIS